VKSKLKTAALISGIHFALWWATIGTLKASGFKLFSLESLFRFAPPLRHSALQELFVYVLGILSLPASLLPEQVWFPDHWFVRTLALALNSAVWGICFTLLFYAVRQRHQRHSA
jgi:hypothetical protein